jgi:hypothetical protein
MKLRQEDSGRGEEEGIGERNGLVERCGTVGSQTSGDAWGRGHTLVKKGWRWGCGPADAVADRGRCWGHILQDAQVTPCA